MVGIDVDIRSWAKAFQAYMKFNKRAIPEALNTKCYFIARNAMNTTVAANKEQIKADLLKPSAIAPGVPIGAILVQRDRRTAGKSKGSRKGLSGEKMQAALEKLIRVRQATANFLRAGFQASIRAIEGSVPKKGGAPKYLKVKTKGVPKGGAKPAKESAIWKSSAKIWNSVQGGLTASPTVQALLRAGLAMAVAMEIKSMQAYIEKKLQEGANKFNRSR